MKSRYLIATPLLGLSLLLPTTLLAWGPYGYGPPPDFGPPWEAPYAGDFPPVPAAPARLRIERSADAGHYYLTIHVTGIDPKGVTVTNEGGRWLAIRSNESNESSYQNTAPDRHGYSRGFSYSSSSQARRIAVPRDADVSAMKREDKADSVRITLPRRH